MKNSKIISFKTQYLLSLIPYVGVFIICFCAFWNLKKLKNKTYSYMLGYWLCVFVPAFIVMGIVGVATRNLLFSSHSTALMVYSISMYLGTLLSALWGVWLQKREKAKIEDAENNAFLG